jgi:hypothetical protein
MKSKIKLLKVDEMENGTIRLQSQLYINRDTVDFIIEGGVLKCYGNGNKGFDFYEYKEPYEIVESKKDMAYQPL